MTKKVLSPSTRTVDLGGKRTVYASESVSCLWLVDSDAQLLAAFELRGTEWLLIETLFHSANISLTPFEAISFHPAD